METHLRASTDSRCRPTESGTSRARHKIDMVNTDMTASTRAHELISKQLEACDKGRYATPRSRLGQPCAGDLVDHLTGSSIFKADQQLPSLHGGCFI